MMFSPQRLLGTGGRTLKIRRTERRCLRHPKIQYVYQENVLLSSSYLTRIKFKHFFILNSFTKTSTKALK